MSVAEIKEIKSNLKEWIDQLSDNNMLSMLEGLRNLNSNNDWWDNLSQSEIQHINEGLDDAKNGRYISSGEFWNRLKND